MNITDRNSKMIIRPGRLGNEKMTVTDSISVTTANSLADFIGNDFKWLISDTGDISTSGTFESTIAVTATLSSTSVSELVNLDNYGAYTFTITDQTASARDLYIIDNQIVTMQKATTYILQSIDKRK